MKPPSDVNQLGRFVISMATEREPEADIMATPDIVPAKNPAAVALGRLGGLKGGKARAAALTEKRRKAIARKAAQVRWSKKG